VIQNVEGVPIPLAAMAGPDDASDTPEARTIGRIINATRRVERMVMRSPFASKKSNVVITDNQQDIPRMRGS
jgi:hypothetical protein